MAKLVFVTGASSGIGQALARRFYQAGYSLALVARRTAEVEQWASAAGMDKRRYQVYHAELSVIDSIVSAGRQCLERQGVPEVVVASAGISIGVDTEHREDIDVIARTFAVNNVGMAATFHPFVGPMKQRGSGTFVGIASVNAIRGIPGHGANCPSKAAVVNYCESLRGELRSAGIKVVTICPGYVDTPLTQGNDYSMPFLMSAVAFSDRAFRTIESGVSYRVIPWQMAILAKLLRLLPNFLFDRLLAGRSRKRRASEA